MHGGIGHMAHPPSWADTLPGQTQPPWADTPHWIQSMSGWYPSYWNVFLLDLRLQHHKQNALFKFSRPF